MFLFLLESKEEPTHVSLCVLFFNLLTLFKMNMSGACREFQCNQQKRSFEFTRPRQNISVEQTSSDNKLHQTRNCTSVLQ